MTKRICALRDFNTPATERYGVAVDMSVPSELLKPGAGLCYFEETLAWRRESGRMVVRYFHGSECYCVELDLDGVQDERSIMYMTQRRIVIYLGTSVPRI
jgi:hypothetical protein